MKDTEFSTPSFRDRLTTVQEAISASLVTENVHLESSFRDTFSDWVDWSDWGDFNDFGDFSDMMG